VLLPSKSTGRRGLEATSLSAHSARAAWSPKRRTARSGGQRRRVHAQPEAVGEPGQVVEDANDVGHFEAAFVVEPNLVEGSPILGADQARVGAQLLGDRTERALAGGERRV